MNNSIKKILYLGPRGSYSQIAMESFKEKLKLKTKADDISSITRVLQELNNTDDTIAVLPVENSIEGIV